MKQNSFQLIALFFILQTFNLNSQTTENQIITQINQVTIHLKGAEIIREKNISIQTGRQSLVFTNLSPKLNPKSVQVTASNDVQILSITSKINFLKAGKKSPEIQLLNDSLKVIQIQNQNLEDEKNAFIQEQNLLLKNQQLRGNNSSISVDELKKAANFYRSRFKEINSNLSRIKRTQKDLAEEMNLIRQQLTELNAGEKPTSEIYVSINSKNPTTSKLKLRYVVDDAGWSPIYDLVASDLNEDISLKYRALAFNNTGTNWEEVKIRLSTADPYQGAGKPILKPWILSRNEQIQTKIYNYSDKKQEENQAINNYLQSQNFVLPKKSKGKVQANVQFQTIEISELNTDFDIEEPYTIPSDFKPYSIDISEHSLPATFKHFAVPKLDRDAFLLAQITGWEDLDLISGPMNVYQGETYVGLANLNSRTISDTLELSLGRDQKVTLKREKRKEFSKNRFLGDKKISAFSYQISAKNNHSTPINIEVLDQVPISNNKEISIDIKELSKAQHYSETGKLKWEFSMNPNQTKSLNFAYNVKHPKTMEVKLFRSRKATTPRYF